MASSQALGSALGGYNFFLTPDANAKLMQIQQQQALANALLNQGLQPINTNGRMMGQIAYKISPFEGLAKIAQALSGRAGQQQAIESEKQLFSPQPSAQDTQTALDAQSSMPGLQQGPTQAAADTAQGIAVNPNLSPVAQQMFPGMSAAQQALLPMLASDPNALAKLMSAYAPPPDVRTAEYAMGNPQAARAYLAHEMMLKNSPGYAAMQTAQGTAAAGNLPAGSSPQMFNPYAGSQAAAQQPQGMMPPQAAALQEYRQQNGMPTPPIDNQRAAMGLPIGSSSMGAIPPVPASQLQPPPNMQQQVGQMPSILPGETNNQYQARLEAAKAGNTKESQDLAANLADATKTFNVAASNLPRAMQRFSQLREASKNASYGAGVSDIAPEADKSWFIPDDWARDLARTTAGRFLEPKTGTANQIISQAANQGILAELGPQLAGLKGNKFLETIASGASGLNPADTPEAKQNAVNGLQDQYISNLVSLANQRRQYGDPNAPTDLEMAKLISQNSEPTYDVHIVHPNGTLGTIKARSLLQAVQAGARIQ